MGRFARWVRWFVVLSGAFVVAIIAPVLTPLVSGFALVWGGSQIALKYRREAAVVLFGIWMAFLIQDWMFGFSLSDFREGRLIPQNAGSVAMGIVGASAALWLVRLKGTPLRSGNPGAERKLPGAPAATQDE